MVRSALALFAQRGTQGTSFADVLARSGAPRGSVYHHFPGGKDELVGAALEHMAEDRDGVLSRLDGADAVGIVDRFVDMWQALLRHTDFAAGCSVLGITVTTESDDLRSGAGVVFARWSDDLARRFGEAGLAAGRARELAWTLVAASEGAVAVARSLRSMEPLEAVRSQLRALAGQPAG